MSTRFKRRFQQMPREDLPWADDSDEEFEDAVALARLLADEGKRVRKERQRGKTYLTRADLLRTPDLPCLGKLCITRRMTGHSS